VNRRQFLTGIGVASAALPAHNWAQTIRDSGRELKITGIEAIAVKVPPSAGVGSCWMFVKLLTNKKDLAGYGEVYRLGIPFSPPTLVRMIEDFGGELVVGEDPYHIESLFERGYNYGYSHHPDFARLGIISGIEMACWDIVGKDLNKPVYDLLGGPVRDRIRTYTYIEDANPPLAGKDRLWHNPQACAERARYYVDQGFTAVKLDPVQDGSKAIDDYQMTYPTEETVEALERSEEVIGAVRKAVGNKCDIMIGTHGQFTAAGAIRFAKRLEKFDPLWFEEPVPPDDMAEMAVVARGTSIPVCTGERLTSKYEFARLIESKAAAILNFDLGRVGGILEAKKIAAMAEAHYLQISPHLWGGPILAAACLQIDACSPNFLIQESMETLGGFHAELLMNPIEWKNGFIIRSRRPGLGYDLNETAARKYAFQ
jgi:2-dehydro-3-deoxyphosphogalactonate aldolase